MSAVCLSKSKHQELYDILEKEYYSDDVMSYLDAVERLHYWIKRDPDDYDFIVRKIHIVIQRFGWLIGVSYYD